MRKKPKKRISKKDETLETLLDLDGEIFLLENGYWVKFVSMKVPPSPHVPYGVRYSLTLHDRNNSRLLGFDNAHAVRRKDNRYVGRIITWDHKHCTNKVVPYQFQSASQLIEDFWIAVEEVMR